MISSRCQSIFADTEFFSKLLGKAYADFTVAEEYSASFEKLVKDVGVVFNQSAMNAADEGVSLGSAAEKAWVAGLQMLSKPFHRPYQYMGMTVAGAAEAVGAQPNKVGNIIVDTPECHMLLEAEGNFINYVDVELKQTAPHNLDEDFDSEVVLGALSINPTELDLARKQTHYHAYYDHRKKLKIGVQCAYDGAPLSVGFSSKYYGD